MATDEITIRRARDGDVAICEEILRSLSDWFGIEGSIVQYRADIESMPTLVAILGGRTVGFLTLKEHNSHTSEIQVMAVLEEYHGRGIGGALVRHAEKMLRAQAAEYLQVKTLGPSRSSEHYDRTREFYLSLGFRPLEETDLWGEANPCLILVKHLACA